MPDEPKKGFDAELDDWASAIDEWDANLALPAPPAVDKPKAELLKPAQPVAKPVPIVPAPPAPAAHHDEPAPLEAAPLEAAPLELPIAAPAAADDPLMHLFDGEMELPEEAGEALGTLLGEEAPAPAVPPSLPLRDGTTGELELEASFGDFGAAESTRVAEADEVSALLDNLDELEPELSQPLPSLPPSPSDEPKPTLRLRSPDSIPTTRLPSRSSLPTIRQPSPIKAPEGDAPELETAGDFGGAESTRVAETDEFEALLDIPILDEPAPAPPPGRAPAGGLSARKLPSAPQPTLDVDIDVDSKVGLPEAVAKAPPAPVVDEDFYDDISIEAGRDEPSRRAPQPVPSGRVASSLDELSSEPILVDPPLSVAPEPHPARLDRQSDPDRTPLPVPDETSDDGLFADAAPEAPMPAIDSRPVLATRVQAALPEPSAAFALPEQVEPRALDPGYLRQLLGMYDTERLLKSDDPARAARLGCSAARVCEQLGDLEGAEERYEAALAEDAATPAALRGLRRVRLSLGKSDRVVTMLEREMEHSSPAEKRALESLRAELHFQRGDRDLAREAWQGILEQRPDDLGAALGMCDVASGEGSDELSEALGRLAEALG
jgi:hypothetical protein